MYRVLRTLKLVLHVSIGVKSFFSYLRYELQLEFESEQSLFGILGAICKDERK